MSSPDFNALLKALLDSMRKANPDVQIFSVGKDGELTPEDANAERRKVLRLIQKHVDIDLVNALSQWFASQEVQSKIVISSIAFFLANELYRSCSSEDEACVISQDFGDYLHQSIHVLYKENGPPKKD